MKTIQKIEPKFPEKPVRKKVAGYCRVSMESNQLLHSLSAQVSYYSSLIQKHLDWEYAGVYSDSGISGTTSARAGVQTLLADCEAGKIDVILTKSISRFARNTVDLLGTVRHLKKLGVEVRFEKENISTFSDDGELMLSILASYAQEESLSIGENIKWGIRKKFKDGVGHCYILFGYRWDGKQFNIVPEEAEVVRLIFDNYLKGISPEQTARILREQGVLSLRGNFFDAMGIRKILRQVRYTGNALFQKTYTESHITHKKVVNQGELPQYYVEDANPAIISQEVFDQVQAEMRRRREQTVQENHRPSKTVFTSKVMCGSCNASYWRRPVYIGKDKKRAHDWRCKTKEQHGSVACLAKNISETVLKEVAAKVLGIDVFDEAAFLRRIGKIVVFQDNTLLFRFLDGTEVIEKWEPTAIKKSWTPELRKAVSELKIRQAAERREQYGQENHNNTRDHQ
jgi:DNA invertase Pin-like site-specific DNA recombinase